MATQVMPTRDDFAAMLNETLGDADSFEGRVVHGTVTGIENDMAVIDVGLKSEGRVPLREFAAPGQKADLKVGDHVVHVDNGIGVFVGLKQINVGHETREFMELRYAGDYKLFVPVDRLDLVQKFSGSARPTMTDIA